MPPVCTQEKVNGNLKETLYRDCLVFFLEWSCKSLFQTRNPAPGPAGSTLISLFQNLRNSSLIAYSKSSFKATGSDF